MATLITVTAKAVTIQRYRLETQQDMLDALTFLSGLEQPYGGSINRNVIDGVAAWWLTLTNPHGTGYTGYIGDSIILENGTAATICRQQDYDTFYNAP
jgi:hypothetical protein